MKNIKEFKEWLEKEIEVWELHYDMASAEDINKLGIIYGRLKELERTKKIFNEDEEDD